MDLSHVFGFPLWEKAVFRLLHRAFGDINSIFAAHAPAAGRMPQSMLTSLARECGLETEGFPMARVRSVFQRAGQPEDGKAGDGALELHEFLEAVVQLSFSRANPRCGEAGHENDAPAHPLPGCLEQMLTKNLLQGAKRSRLAAVKEEMLADREVIELFRP